MSDQPFFTSRDYVPETDEAPPGGEFDCDGVDDVTEVIEEMERDVERRGSRLG